MTLIRYQPWNRLNQLQREMNKLFDYNLGDVLEGDETRTVASDWVPAVDIKEEPDHYIIKADIPGVDPKDIEVTMEKGVLTLRGHRESETKEEREGYKRVERSQGSFYRSFSLPDTADAERVSAKGKNGTLEIVIPKAETVKPRRITIEE